MTKAKRAATRPERDASPVRLVLQILSLALLVGCAYYVFDLARQPGQAAQPDRPAAALAGSGEPAALLASPAAGGYARSDLGTVAYGSAAGEVGLSTQMEARARGPSSFAVDRDGKLYVGDDVNERVQVFSPVAKHLGTLKVGERIRDLVVADAADLYVLSFDGEVLSLDRATGKLRGRWALEGKPASSLGRLRVAASSLNLDSPQQIAYQIGDIGPSGLTTRSAADQEKQARKGGRGVSTASYTTSYRDGGHVYRLDAQGTVIQDVALGLASVLSVQYLDEDRLGSFYVQVESLGEDRKVSVSVWQFDKHGKRTAVVPIEPLTYVEMVRSVVVTNAGTIYQAVPTEQGLRFLKWDRP